MNLRMFGIAAALLLVPAGLGAATDPIFEIWGDAVAIITDVELVNPPQDVTYNNSEFYAEEQLVEGHTVFATIEFRAYPVESEGNISIDGHVSCDHEVRVDTVPWMGIPIPTRIERAQVACQVGERVFVTPDPFETGGSSANPPTPTGIVMPFEAPTGWTYAEEFTYVAGDGKSYYAWAVPILEPWENARGTAKNFMLPMPIEKLRHNDVRDYSVYLMSS